MCKIDSQREFTDGSGALYQRRGVGCGGRWEGGSKGKRYMYTYVLLMLRFDKKQQKSAKELSFN